ncbi:unnamed protein product [Orchesella dallaii]|uniref:SHSP domain-containing protein n=1 Tax=Orchesella dallaii TaxID=48710 RepID=A0ABP1R139_9HEXA
MPDFQSPKPSKSKSRNGQSKNGSLQSFSSSCDANNNLKKGSSAATTSTLPTNAGASLLQKLNLEHLKHIPFNTIKPKSGASAKDIYIDYALDMVINNLIMSGHLDPGKAGQMRSPVMKSQIAAICDSMLPKKNSKGSKTGTTKKATPLTRSKPKTQKWAVQPTSLPITIITDQIPPHTQAIMTVQDVVKTKGSRSKLATGNIIEEPKRKKSKKGSNKHVDNPAAIEKKVEKSEQPSTWSMQYDSVNANRRGPSSEVPSASHSMILQNDFSTNKTTEDAETKPLRNVQFKGSDLFKSEGDQDQSKQTDECLSKRECTVFTPLFPPLSDNRNRSAASTSPSGTRLQSSTVTSNTSISTSGGFHILIDMRGFSNDEISMEVEGRLLIFLASRNKKNGQSARKVTEIVDVPSGVSLENLKIGRRVDGYVIVEEYETEQLVS